MQSLVTQATTAPKSIEFSSKRSIRPLCACIGHILQRTLNCKSQQDFPRNKLCFLAVFQTAGGTTPEGQRKMSIMTEWCIVFIEGSVITKWGKRLLFQRSSHLVQCRCQNLTPLYADIWLRDIKQRQVTNWAMVNVNSYNIKQNFSVVILKNREHSKLILNLYKALLKLSTLLWY